MIALLLVSAWALQLEDVLTGVDARHPVVVAAAARVDEAEGLLRESRGAFDPTLSAKASGYGGKYDRSALDAGLSVKTTLGPKLKVGYGRGVGDIPPYAGDSETGPSGELYAEVSVPLLDGLGMGASRAKLMAAGAKVEASDAKRFDVLRQTRLSATEAYWKWRAAVDILRISEEQLLLAERRATALAREVELGSRPQLDVLDNLRVLNERTVDEVRAEQKLFASATYLSLFLRDSTGQPRVPSRDEAPAEWAPPDPLPERFFPEARPDRGAKLAGIEAARVQDRRARNGLFPNLEVVSRGTQPLDSDGKFEVMVGAQLEAPLAFRRASGARRATSARLARAEAELRWLDDKVRAEVETTHAARLAAAAQAQASSEAARLAREVLRLEQRRFELGDSELFKVLLREDVAAKDRKTAVEATLALHLADAQLRAALTPLNDLKVQDE